MVIHFVQEPQVARNLEFLMTSGKAYSSSTVSGNTRKYHGLVVDNGRLFLAGLDEMVNGIRFSSQQYEGSSNDAGLQYLQEFSVYPPTWIFRIDDAVIKKTVYFDGNLVVTYLVNGDADLWIRPLITDRSVHEILRTPHPGCTHERNGFRWADMVFEGDLSYESHPDTYWNVWYQQEHERGYEAIEDLYSPGIFHGHVRDSTVAFRCTIRTPIRRNTKMTLPRSSSETTVRTPRTSLEWLEWASDAFCHNDEIFAGYHWFCESWGRDSAISVTGLLIERGLKNQARAVLKRLSVMNKNGIIPNRFPDNYHSSDASLWFLHALFQYRRCWGDDHFMEKMRPVITNILENYPDSGVALLNHGLISVAPKSTWMDTDFTPRKGKPVEINALWITALEEAESMGIRTSFDPGSARKEFSRFWNQESQCLYDVIDPIDRSIRPNQVVALSLGLVNPELTTSALSTINTLLVTPYGLRSLSPFDKNYHGRYTGDMSYHNGCVWPWLSGCYTEALLRNGVSGENIAPVIMPVLHHLQQAGVGYISEIFDGDPPHLPRGCIAQAWSVAEIARASRLLKMNITLNKAL
jgi:glycogen debranching enzyme